MAETNVEETSAEWLKCLESLQQIRAGNLEPAQFWPLYLEALRALCTAEFGTVAVRGLTEDATWQPIAFSPGPPGPSVQPLSKKLESAAEACQEKDTALLQGESVPWIAMRFNMGAVNQLCVALFSLRQDQAPQIASYLKALSLLNDLPAHFQLSRASLVERVRSEQFAGVLDLMTLLNTQGRALPAAMTFCNELATRYRCDRVSLGWYRNGYIKLRAISHVDDFDKKMEAVRALELAMEEALDQDTEIQLPPPLTKQA